MASLPLVSPDYAARRDWLTVAALAIRFGSVETTIRIVLKRPGAPAPVARIKQERRGARPLVFDLAAFGRFIDSIDGEAALGNRRRSTPPRRVGTTTSSTGSRYVWRDPRRLKSPIRRPAA